MFVSVGQFVLNFMAFMIGLNFVGFLIGLTYIKAKVLEDSLPRHLLNLTLTS